MISNRDCIHQAFWEEPPRKMKFLRCINKMIFSFPPSLMHTSSIFSERFNRSSDFKPYKKEERVLLISNLIKQRFQSIGRWSRRHHRRLFLWHAFNGQVLRLKSFLIAYEIHQINMEDSISLLQHIVRCHHVFL